MTTIHTTAWNFVSKTYVSENWSSLESGLISTKIEK